jgi:NADPH-dependent 2,4-dienoyl-CoA reductase/sulfur reductase-like enzyme
MINLMRKSDRIIIIGNGIAGITFARQMRKLKPDVQITVISGESDYFYSRPALMYLYMGQMKFDHTKPYEDWFWNKNKIELINTWIHQVDFEQKVLIDDRGHSYPYDILVLATGSVPRKLDIKGIESIGVQGFYGLSDLDLMEKMTSNVKRAVVVGGGLVGVELVEMLRYREIEVTFLVREQLYFGNVLPEREAQLLTHIIQDHGVDVRLSTEVDGIEIDSNGKVTGVLTQSGENILCDWVGVAIGVQPNVSFLKNSGLEVNQGILVNRFFETNQAQVYAIGDCAEFKDTLEMPRGRIEQTWYTGRIHGETLANSLGKQKTSYQPGIWFNSAKFFELEYQTYGYVPVVNLESQESFYWESAHPLKAFRIVFDKENQEIIGVHGLGCRLRHQFFEQAISEKWTLQKVLKNLSKADFDPEFYQRLSDVVRNELIINDLKKESRIKKIKNWCSLIKRKE